MKNIILLLSIILTISCSDSNIKKKIVKTDLQSLEINGKVKSLEEKWFDASEKFGEPVKSKLNDWTIALFDELGNKIEEKSFYEDGRICSINTYTYNKENKIIETTFTCGDIFRKGVYKYDKYGNNIDLTYYEGGRITLKEVMKFDKNNNKIDYRKYQYDGVLDTKILSKFDSDNFNIEDEEYSFNGTSCVYSYKKTMKYDEFGNVIEVKEFDEKGNLIFLYKYVYDEKGNRIEKLFSKDNLETKSTSKINKFGHCYESYEYSNGVLKDKFTNVFKYDNKGNWVKRVHYNNGIVNGIDERNIQYYN